MGEESIASLANRWSELPSDHKDKDPVVFIQLQYPHFIDTPDREGRVSEFYDAIKKLGYQGEVRIKEALKKAGLMEVHDLITEGVLAGYIK